ncbi:MAG: hypothetical protein K2X82_09625 [Gemmataceae bacterium]|nr:hypothetical protein [Gemmataceae bacterium]
MARRILALCALALLAGWAGSHQPPAPPAAAPVATDALDGTWELVSLVEEGRPVPLDLVRQTLIKDARVTIDRGFIGFVRPDGAGRTLPFVVNAAVSPKTIDIAGIQNFGGKGVYLRDGDTLLVCLGEHPGDARPAGLVSVPGEKATQLTFTRVAAPAASPPPAPAAPPAPPAIPADDALRDSLFGTWGHQTDSTVFKVTLNPDGTFSSVRTYKRGFRKLFDAEERASGTWRLKDGFLIYTTTAATSRGQVGQVTSARITSVSNGEMIYVDSQTGDRRIEWRLR